METEVDYTIARRRMVVEQLHARGITDKRILESFMSVPRHLFVDPAIGGRAYDDCSFPIGYAQTISQPYTIAFMIQSLRIDRKDRVLEIGTGSGYQTAILSLLAKEIYSIERIASLSQKAETVLSNITTGKIRLKVGDGSNGWKGYSPFNRIIVSAAMKEKPHSLLGQLAEQGALIAPIAEESERLTLFSKGGGGIIERRLSKCAFVPLKKGVGE